MTAPSLVVLKNFLNGLNDEKKNVFISFLPFSYQEELEKIFLEKKPIDLEEFDLLDLLKKLHYSWFIPTLKSYKSQERTFFLKSLPLHFQDKLYTYFRSSKKTLNLSNMGKQFFLDLLLRSMMEEPILPISLLPPSSLNPLAEMTKKNLIEIIDYLSLYDLAREIPKIVSAKTLKWINSLLTPTKQKFLKSKIKTREPFSFPPLHIELYIGKEKKLLSLLHKHGLHRLGKALSNQHLHLLWHICHHLDIGRGSMVFEIAKKKTEENIVKKIGENIVEILDWIKTNR